MKRAIVPLIALIALFSVACVKAPPPTVPTPPVVLNLPDCPAPARPALPRIDGNLPFDSPANVEALMERDDTFRLHIEALESAIDCFRRRKAQPEEKK